MVCSCYWNIHFSVGGCDDSRVIRAHPKRTEHAGDGQARSRFELIDLPDSNPYPPIEAALPDRARHASNVRPENDLFFP